MAANWLNSLFPRPTSRTTRRSGKPMLAKPNLVTLEDRSTPAVISIADASIMEGNAGQQMLVFTVTSDAKAAGTPITFTYSTANGSATAGSDYDAVTNAAGQIDDGTDTTTVSVLINGDQTVEADEDFTVTITATSAGDTVGDDTGTGTILNDDAAVVSISSPSVTEGGMLSFSVSIDNPVDSAVTSDRKTQDGTATVADADYTAVANGNVQLFAANSTTAFTINVATTADGTVELNETLSLILSNLAAGGRNVTFSGGGASLTGTGTILNDDAAVVSISSPSVTEGGMLSFSVSIDNPVDSAVTSDRKTQDGTATVADADYTAVANGNVQLFAANSTTAFTINVATTADGTVELNETLSLILSNLAAGGRNVTFSGGGASLTGTGTILNDDAAVVSISSPSVTEGGMLSFSVSIDNPVDSAVTSDRKTQDGTATVADADYTAVANGNVQLFAANSTTAFTINVATTADGTVELNETLSLILSNLAAGGRNVTFSGGGASLTGTGTILNDDAAVVSISSPSVTEGGMLSFSVSIDNPVDSAVTSDRKTQDGTATVADADYTAVANGNVQLFAANSTTAFTINVATTADGTVELNETLSLILSNLAAGGRNVTFSGGGASLTGTGTILNDDAAVVSISSPSVTEGGMLSFSVSIDNPVDSAVTSDRKTQDGTATVADADYTAVANGNVQLFAANSTTAFTINVATTADGTVELNETLSLILSNLAAGGRNVTFSGGGASLTGTGTILNDDAAVVSISSPSVTEGGMLSFSVSIDNPVDSAVTSDRKTQDGTATVADADYTAVANGNVQLFAANSTTAFTINVATTADGTVELNETLSLILSNLAAGGRNVTFSGGGASLTGTGTILNDDAAVVSIADSSAMEGAAVTFTATLTNPVDVDVTVMLTPSKGGADTATATTDFDTTVKTITILAGQLTGSTTVNTVQDTLVEPDETFTATLSALAAGGRNVMILGAGTATGTITNDDKTTLTVSTTSTVTEGDAGTVLLTFTVTSSKAVQGGFQVAYNTADGTATAGSGDYVALPAGGAGQMLTFTGATDGEAQMFTVMVNGDKIVEANETILGQLGTVTPNDPTVQTSAFIEVNGVGTILDDDMTTLTVSSPTIVEGTGGSTMLMFTVTSSNAVQGGFTVAYNTADGTANAGSDYTTASGVLTFAGTVGEVQTFTVTINPDSTVEQPTETFAAQLGVVTPTNPLIPTSKFTKVNGTGSITDDDSTALTIQNVVQAENGGPMTFTVTLSNPVQGGFTVNYKTTDGTAVSTSGGVVGDNDFVSTMGTLTFAGTAGETQTFTVTINGDNVVEASELFTVSLNTVVPTNPLIPASKIDATGTATGTIVNDDSATVNIDSQVSPESGVITFNVTLTNQVDTTVMVTFNTANGTAIAGAAAGPGVDFIGVNGLTVTFAPGVTAQTVTVNPVDDARVEGTEAFTATISNLVTNRSVTIGTATGTGTILDNDLAVLSFAPANAALEDNAPASFDVTLTIVPSAGSVGTPGLDRQIVTTVDPFLGTVAGKATLGPVTAGDYVITGSTTVTFNPADAPGSLTFNQTVPLQIFEDLTNEGDETVEFTLNSTNTIDGTGGQVRYYTTANTSVPTPNFVNVFTIQNDDAVVRTYDATVAGTYRLVRNGANVQLFLNNALIAQDLFAATPSAIVLNGTVGDDTFIIDMSGGNPIPTGGVTFNGNAGNDTLIVDRTDPTNGNTPFGGTLTFNGGNQSVGDTLILTGGNYANITDTFTNATDGSLATDLGAINYTGAESAQLNVASVQNLTFNLPTVAANNATLQDAGAGSTLTGVAFVNTSFTKPTANLNVNQGTANDLLTVGPGGLNSVANINLGTSASPFKTITQTGAVTTTGNASYFAGTIALNNTLKAANVTLVAGTSATQTGAITTGLLTLGEANNAGDYTLAAANDVQALTVPQAKSVTFNDANDVTVANAKTTANLLVTAGNSLTVPSGITVQSTAGSVTLTATNTVTIAPTATVTSANGTTLTAGSNLAIGSAATVQSTAGSVALTAGNDLSVATMAVVRSAAGTTLSAGKALAIGSAATVQSTAGSVSLTAGTNLTVSPTATVQSATGTAATAGKNLTISGATVQATAGGITLNSGDDFTAVGAVLSAALNKTIAIAIDTDNSGPATADLRTATITAMATTLVGNANADTFRVTGYTTPVAIDGKNPTAAPGDVLEFDAQNKVVTATVNSFDTAGAPVSYVNIETITVLNAGTFTLNGTNGDDRVTVRATGTPGAPLSYQFDGQPAVIVTPVPSFTFNGLAGRDTLIADFSNGSPIPAGGITFNGGADADFGLAVVGNANNAASLTTNKIGPDLSGVVVVDSGTITYSGLETSSEVDISGIVNVNVNLMVPDGNVTINNSSASQTRKITTDALAVAGTTTPVVRLSNNTNVIIATDPNNGGADNVTIAGGTNAHNNTNLTISAPDDAITATGPLAVNGNLTVIGNAITVQANANLTAGGDLVVTNNGTLTIGSATLTGQHVTQTAVNPVVLTGDAVVAGTATTGNTITFNGPIDGPGGLTANTAGNTVFNKAVGGTTALSKLVTDAGGLTLINGGLVKTATLQSYGDKAVTSVNGTQLIATGGAINFLDELAPTIDGFDLVIGGPNVDITASKGVASDKKYGSLQIVNTNNATFNGPVTTLSKVEQVAGSGTTTFNGPVTSPTVLIDNGNVVTFNGAVVAATRVEQVNATGTTTFNGAVTSPLVLIDNAGDVTFNGAVAAATRVELGNVTGAAKFASTVTSPVVQVDNGNVVVFGGAVETNGGVFEQKFSKSLTFNGVVNSGTVLIDDGVDVTFNGAVTVGDKIVQTTGTGKTTFSDVTANGTTGVTGGKTGGAVNINTNAIVFNGNVSAPNAPIVLGLTGTTGSVTQPNALAGLSTTKLYLRGDGTNLTFNLNSPVNTFTAGTPPAAGDTTFVSTGEVFANVGGGSINVRDKTDLVIAFENPASPATAIRVGNNGSVTLSTSGNFTAVDPVARVGNAPTTKLLDVGSGGTVQVNFGFDFPAGVTDPTVPSFNVTFAAEATASKVVLGQPLVGGDPTLTNRFKDVFTVRPLSTAQLFVNGNLPVTSDGTAFAPFDTLNPLFKGVTGISLSTSGNGNGVYTFTGFQPLTFESIETLGGLSVEAFAVQTAPRQGSTDASGYVVRLAISQITDKGANVSPLGGNISGTGITNNAFVVSPVLNSSSTSFKAPTLAIGDVNGDGTADLIIANGAGDAPLVTVVDGAVLTSLPPGASINLGALQPSQILTQFFAYEETFRGGVNVAVADLNGDGRAEIVVGSGVGGGPVIRVFSITDAKGNGDPSKGLTVFNNFKPLISFPAYELSFRGGVNVAVGDLNGDGRPEIIAGAGVLGGPRVRIYDGAHVLDTLAVLNDFFAYEPSYRGGVLVAAGRYDSDSIDDLMTAPGSNGGPRLRIFQGTQDMSAALFTSQDPPTIVNTFAFTNSTGLISTDQTNNLGVGSISFGSSADGSGGNRSVLVSRPRGAAFEVLKFTHGSTLDVVNGNDTTFASEGSNQMYQTVLNQNSDFVDLTDPNLILANPNTPRVLVPFTQLRSGGSVAGGSVSSN
ncbi:beta strand repeat-containing protein [Limnoglobus roseus]|uniref:Calx-beta domain-containing protein n=1 Tax=Limnoglobus roseus TaxID=2598579 RepID=A0A5C1AMD6_9BACT|nr:Calx-beta domain-containing protein [Limnoglobus roseus]QEL19745.1 hypothetical protein PX52LOC_06824 [Limnoglobus roseus]